MRQDLYNQMFREEEWHFWHTNKRALIFNIVKNLKLSSGKVLDLGAGTGKILTEFKNRGWQVYGVDKEQASITFCQKRNLSIKKFDLDKNKKLPFKKNSLDLVLCLDLLEHLENEQRLIKEVKRVLKKDALLIITVPAYPQLFSYWDKMVGHKRRYNKKNPEMLFKKAGFRRIKTSYFYSFVLPIAIIVRFLKRKWAFNNQTKNKSDFQFLPLSFLTNPILKFFGFLERILLKFTDMPFGLSIIGVFKK